jgi:glucose dehydrogenase
MSDHAGTLAALVASGLFGFSACATSRIGVSAITPAMATAADGIAPTASPQDWPSYNRTLAGDRLSPLADLWKTNTGQSTGGGVISYSAGGDNSSRLHPA